MRAAATKDSMKFHPDALRSVNNANAVISERRNMVTCLPVSLNSEGSWFEPAPVACHRRGDS